MPTVYRACGDMTRPEAVEGPPELSHVEGCYEVEENAWQSLLLIRNDAKRKAHEEWLTAQRQHRRQRKLHDEFLRGWRRFWITQKDAQPSTSQSS